jgi:SAM-dependent methyltransferase
MSAIIGKIHSRVIFNRRVEILAAHISNLLHRNAKVLDVGCGDGLIDSLILRDRPDVSIQGIDILLRKKTHIPVFKFDSKKIPFDTGEFDTVMFIDVLHHTDDPAALLKEAKRVAGKSIVIKDHTKNGFLAGPILHIMDWTGNSHHNVVLPYNYMTEDQWQNMFEQLNLETAYWEKRIDLYSWPLSAFFDRSLHFIAELFHK